jgi:hypothetical protein
MNRSRYFSWMAKLLVGRGESTQRQNTGSITCTQLNNFRSRARLSRWPVQGAAWMLPNKAE